MLAEPLVARLVGHDRPRIAPPVPARSSVGELQRTATGMGIDFIPWQIVVGRYLEALTADDLWLYPEVAALVARQNGKTEILLPHIKRRLEMGRRVLHLAQTRELPRRLFNRLVPLIERDHPDAKVRRASGQEVIELSNGGVYFIAAATGGGARGASTDDLLVDEVRELDEDVIGAALPTISASLNPQVVYLSNAGHESSVVLNSIRDRAGKDPSLAYLEWSADPERRADDREGWAEANPSIAHFPALMDVMERAYRSAVLGGTISIFETEHLCRWVASIRERLVGEAEWVLCEAGLEAPVRPLMAISMSPDGTRASAAIAWNRPDGTVGLRTIFDVRGSPIDTDKLGKDMRTMARNLGVTVVGFDPLTDAVLAKFFRRTEAITGGKYANASARFVAAVQARKVQWADCGPVGDDLVWTAKKPHDESGSFQAVRADDDRPITAALAAIRAVWLASVPRPEPTRPVPSLAGF